MKAICYGFLGFVMECQFEQPPKPTTVVCPPVIEWRADLQKRAAAELKALPKGSATAELMDRAIEQRNVNRRCLETKGRPK